MRMCTVLLGLCGMAMAQPSWVPASPQHQFVVGPTWSEQTASKAPESAAAQPVVAQTASATQMLNVADAVVFFQQAMFLTFNRAAVQPATQRLVMAQCYHPTAWQQLQRLNLYHAVQPYTSVMVPLAPPQFSVVKTPRSGFHLNIQMPIQIGNATVQRDHHRRHMIAADVVWVGKQHGLRGWQIQHIRVMPWQQQMG